MKCNLGKIDIMIEKILNVAITKCYGNADKNSTRGKFTFSAVPYIRFYV